MHKTTMLPWLTAGLLLSGALLSDAAHAQEASPCPMISADTGLTWDARTTGDSQLCRALRADGSEAFGLYISPKPSFEPSRSDRAEEGRIDGQSLYWYRAELAAQPGVEARETVVALPDGRSAHIWLQAPNEEALGTTLQLVQGLRFNANTQVAGQ